MGHEGRVLARVTLEKLLSYLSEEEREIIRLYYVEEMTFDEVAEIILVKYRDPERDTLTGSAVRYHRDKILEKLDSVMQEKRDF